MRTIAIFLPNWIGDVVMATPAVRAVREHFPHSRLIAVGKPYVADTLAGAPWFDAVVPFDKRGGQSTRFRSVLTRLRSERIETAVLFPNSFRPALLAALAGCRTIVGFARYGRDALLSKRLYPARDDRGRSKPVPMIDDYNRVVQFLGVRDPGHRMELFTTPDEDLAAEKIWYANGLNRYRSVIGLNPGGAFGAAKHWPTESFATLARTLADRGYGVLVLCGPTERDIAEKIVAAAGRPAVTSLADAPLSIGLTKACVRRLNLLVTTDSGPRHFAAAFDVPVLSLFGPTHIGWTETYFAKAEHLQRKMPCGPCQQRICPLGHHHCMTELSPVNVARAALDLLSRFPFVSESRHAS